MLRFDELHRLQFYKQGKENDEIYYHIIIIIIYKCSLCTMMLSIPNTSDGDLNIRKLLI